MIKDHGSRLESESLSEDIGHGHGTHGGIACMGSQTLTEESQRALGYS